MLWSSWQPQVLLEVRPSDVPKVLTHKVGRQNHTLVHFLQIKLPACRIINFLKNDGNVFEIWTFEEQIFHNFTTRFIKKTAWLSDFFQIWF